jgi:hypothetical protein
MPEASLDTTNLLLGIMAAVSVLQLLLLAAVGIMAYKAYARAMQAIRDIERLHIAPLVSRANAAMATVEGVVADVKGITSRIGAHAERVDSAMRSTIHRIDETTGRVRGSVASRVNRVMGVVSGVRVAVESLFNARGRRSARETPGDAQADEEQGG